MDLEKAQRLGVSPGCVRRAEATLLQGIQVGSVFEEQKVFDVVVQGAPETRRSMEDVENLLIDRPGGGYFRLGDVADVRTVQTAAVIHRDAVSRRLDIVAGVDGRSVSDVAADLEQRLAGQDLPLEYHAEVLQNSTAEEIGFNRAIGFAIAAAVAAFLLFQAAFQSWRLAAITFLALPLSLVGGLIAGLLTEQQLSLGSLLGLLAVLGLAARMSTMMVSTLQAAPDAATSERAREQFAPVLTSTVAIGLLTLPFVILGSRPGLEIVHPLAVVLLGGLLTTALVTLFVLPSVYRHTGPHPVQRPSSEPEAAARRRECGVSRPPRRRRLVALRIGLAGVAAELCPGGLQRDRAGTEQLVPPRRALLARPAGGQGGHLHRGCGPSGRSADRAGSPRAARMSWSRTRR